ncbi:hypothetical protein NECID01_1137 [Nematocida sp. AWRm77]|nr:hypothetical protein NECID01_1137 [Nematocida sp. AWRm77]
MKKTETYITLCALAMIYLCSAIKVNFKLGSKKEELVCKVPKGMFKLVDKQELYNDFFADPNETSSDLEEDCDISLSYINTPEEYEHFKTFWETDLTPLSAKEDEALSQYRRDLSQDLFDRFLFTANHLSLQGENTRCFTTNMVQYGLRGKHSKDITDNSMCQNIELPYSTFWSLLYAFLDQTGFEYKSVIYSSIRKNILEIENASVHSKKIDEEYTELPQAIGMRTVLHTPLGPALFQEKERNEAVLVWLLLNMGGSSVDIQYPIQAVFEDISELKSAIERFTKESKKGTCVDVEGLTLLVDYRNNFSLLPFLQLAPGLSCLDLSIISPSFSNAETSSLISDVTSCKDLKTLKVTGRDLESEVIRRLIERFPNIEQLSFSCQSLEAAAIDSLKKCTRLERLCLHGEYQTSAVVQAVLRNHPLLTELSINCQALDFAAAKSFQALKQLEKLKIFGEDQPSVIVQEILRHLSSVNELLIKCQALEPVGAESLKACAQLEKLVVSGENQPSAAVQALVTYLPYIKSLTIMAVSLGTVEAESFETCRRLERLVIFANEGGTSFLIKLLEVLPYLYDVKIKIDTADFPLADALWKNSNLRSLELIVCKYTPGFINHYYLKSRFPKLNHLKLCNLDKTNSYSKEDYQAVKKMTALGICVFVLEYRDSSNSVFY